MKRLILFELYKLSRKVSFYICLGIVLLGSLLNVVFQYFTFQGILAEASISAEALEALKPSANYMMLMSMQSSGFIQIIGIFIIIFLCEDYTGKTIKNVYSHGFTRTQVYFSKLIVGLIAVTASFLVTLGFNFIVAYAFFAKVGEAAPITTYLAQYAAVVCMFCFTAMLSFWAKTLSRPIVFLILTEGILLMLFSIVMLLFEFNGVELEFNLTNYLFTSFLSFVSETEIGSETLMRVFIGSVSYSAVFVAVGWLVNRKHEL